jgi:hypothetical protein
MLSPEMSLVMRWSPKVRHRESHNPERIQRSSCVGFFKLSTVTTCLPINWRELWVTITGNFLKELSGNSQLQIGVFTDTALVKERHYLLRLQVYFAQQGPQWAGNFAPLPDHEQIPGCTGVSDGNHYHVRNV